MGMSYATLVRILHQIDFASPQPLLRSRRPSPGRLLLAEESVLAFKAAVDTDPLFWQRNRIGSRARRKRR